jgi:hypothetical protein
VTTGGTQAYDGQATLGASTTLTGSSVTFLDKVVGAGNGLTVSGDAVFGNAAADTVTGLSTLHVTGSERDQHRHRDHRRHASLRRPGDAGRQHHPDRQQRSPSSTRSSAPATA